MSATPSRTEEPVPPLEPEDPEAILAAAIQRLTDEWRRGNSPDLGREELAHPELSQELRELWAAAMIAEEMARVSDHDDATLAWGSGSSFGFGEAKAVPSGSASFAGHELLEELGRGGMGIVYRARQVDHGRVVALKRLLRGDTATPPDLARFHGEAAAASRLAHPHIVPLHYVGEHEGEPFFVMSYVEGTTLAKRLAAGPMPPADAVRLLAKVARAVHYAHGQGVLHRDLKPSNILIDRGGEPYVVDFGLAKRIDVDASLTRSGAILGTPNYMAPEQAAGGRLSVGPAADVYSLGAILYQMLTGRPPFQAASAVDTLLLVREQDPVPPRLLNPKVQPDLEMIALKCLEKSPEQRYASAAALADDLDAFLSGEPVSARSTSLRALASRLLAETHHASVLENWGTLWICHSVALIVFFGLSNLLLLRGVTARWPFVLIFTVGLGAWAAVFWTLRRRGGPISFVERQLAHIWGAGVVGINLILLTE